MKTHFLLITVAAGLLLAATPNVKALPPRQHSADGVVESIDCGSRSITLQPKDGGVPLLFVWKDSTRFTRKGGCAKYTLSSGQTVQVWYRREVGQNVLREINARGTTTKCSAVCK